MIGGLLWARWAPFNKAMRSIHRLSVVAIRALLDRDLTRELLWVVFDGPPSHESGRFVEVHNAEGEGVTVEAQWMDEGDGFWTLGPFVDAGSRGF